MQKKIGPAWSGRRRPAAGFLTKRLAETWLDDVLAQARRAELPGMVQTGATVADAAAEWLRYVEHDRACKPSTLTDYRHTADRIVRELGLARISVCGDARGLTCPGTTRSERIDPLAPRDAGLSI